MQAITLELSDESYAALQKAASDNKTDLLTILYQAMRVYTQLLKESESGKKVYVGKDKQIHYEITSLLK